MGQKPWRGRAFARGCASTTGGVRLSPPRCAYTSGGVTAVAAKCEYRTGAVAALARVRCLQLAPCARPSPAGCLELALCGVSARLVRLQLAARELLGHMRHHNWRRDGFRSAVRDYREPGQNFGPRGRPSAALVTIGARHHQHDRSQHIFAAWFDFRRYDVADRHRLIQG